MNRRISGQIFHCVPINLWIGLAFVFLSSCASSTGHLKLKNALENEQFIELTAQFEEDGIIVLPDVVINGTRMNFILDTGATRSALFESQYERLFNPEIVSEEINVHGITEMGGRPWVRAPSLGLGELTFTDIPLVILPDRNKSLRYDGLIGMDILESFSLYFSRTDASLRLIPKDIPIDLPSSWNKTSLQSNPFKEDGRNLHFFNVDLAGEQVPAMLDTGAEFNLMNWGLKDNSELRRAHRKLREAWEYQGAIGVFRPALKVRSNLLKSGGISWKNMQFIVLGLDGLKILGAEEDLLIIAGMKFLENDEFFIDFERNVLSVKP